MYAKSFFSSESSIMSQPSLDMNFSESDVDSPTYTPMKGGRQSIDYSKFKTKMCRNYVLGLRCPFEDRCAFSHGPVPRSQMPPPPPSYAAAVTEPSAPPSYATFVAAESPDVSRPPSPPQYPTKYRFDPYNTVHGVVFEN